MLFNKCNFLLYILFVSLTTCFFLDELSLPITVDDYKNRLGQLQEELFTKASLMPG